MLNLQTTSLMYSAMEAADKRDITKAKQFLREFEEAFARERETSTEYERLTVLSSVARIYLQVDDIDMAINYFQEVCACAEKVAPNTSATAGDYSTFAEILANSGRLKEAIVALEAAIRHLKGCGEWERYKDSYERLLVRLKKDAAD